MDVEAQEAPELAGASTFKNKSHSEEARLPASDRRIAVKTT
jgi:hypothetical protein